MVFWWLSFFIATGFAGFESIDPGSCEWTFAESALSDPMAKCLRPPH